jgi:hypothetical protein
MEAKCTPSSTLSDEEVVEVCDQVSEAIEFYETRGLDSDLVAELERRLLAALVLRAKKKDGKASWAKLEEMLQDYQSTMIAEEAYDWGA